MNQSTPIDFKTLSFSSRARICWGFFWRSLVAGLGSALSGALIGGVVGGILGVLIHFTNLPESTGIYLIQLVSGIFGLLWGCVCFYFYIKWLLASRLGRFRLLLVHAD